ncbi:MAG: hypothetical protein HYV18_08100 [Gammaproteobacteria bacterium]|nr:hypothetical protein [Gammaproteobacteria bacterium]
MIHKKLIAGVALGAAALSSPAVLAGALTGNVGVVSTYMFRGVDQNTNDTAVQGGVDYAVGNGAYVGSWASNMSAGNELDIYGGYTGTFGSFTYDVGGIYYFYSEENDPSAAGVAANDFNTIELYVGGGYGPVSAKAYFTNDLAGSDESALYLTASATLAFNDTLSLVPALGFYSGDGAKKTFGDEYADYNISLVKALKDDTSVSFGLVGTDREKDDPKVVLGLKKSFKL